jgi:hypothetical protein
MGKQGVGSAVNDTTRERGGALGVAVLGSIFATRYHSLLGSLQQLPAQAQQAARASVGGALGVAQQMGGNAGAALERTAKHAFVVGQSTAFLLAAGVVLGAAVLVWRIMPVHLSYDYESLGEEPPEDLGGPLESAEGADQAVDNGHDPRRRGEKTGVGAGSVPR